MTGTSSAVRKKSKAHPLCLTEATRNPNGMALQALMTPHATGCTRASHPEYFHTAIPFPFHEPCPRRRGSLFPLVTFPQATPPQQRVHDARR